MDTFFYTLAHEFDTPFQNSVLVFAVILFIILLSPLLLRKIRIPGIIGLIISGVVVGPHGLNLIERNSAVELFSTIGLLYILFIAGLELDMNSFRQNRYKSMLYGALTFLLPMLIGYPVCRYLLGYGVGASLITTSLFATHTLVAYPIVSRLGIARNQSVEVTVGGTIITDTAVLILLAVIVGYNTGGSATLLWPRLIISFLLFLGVVFYVIPRVSAWFFKKLEAEKTSHYVFVLAVLFFCAFLAEMAGLESIIGAFAAGLALNRLIPVTSPLMNRIEFAGNSLFIPFFLISVGMLVDLRVIFSGVDVLYIAGVLIVVAIGTKWLAAWITATALRYSKAQRRLMFGLSTARAAATLAIILVGIENNIVDTREQNATILLILVTSLVSSLVTEEAARKVALAMESGGGEMLPAARGQKIMVSLANPDTMERLLDLAFSVRLPASDHAVTGLAIVLDNEEAERKLIEARAMLEKARRHSASADYKLDLLTTIDQNVAGGIRRIATEQFATDLIIGYSGRTSLTDLLFGKTMQAIIDHTRQGVMVSGLRSPLHVHSRLLLFCPPFVEKDPGFASCLANVVQLTSVQGLSLHIYSSALTETAVRARFSQSRTPVSPAYNSFPSWDSFARYENDLLPSDLLVAVIPRNGTIAFDTRQNNVLQRISDRAPAMSFILVYPGSSVEWQGALTGDFNAGDLRNNVTRIAQGARELLGALDPRKLD